MDFFTHNSIPENWVPPSLAENFLEQIYGEIPENFRKKAGVTQRNQLSPWQLSLMRYQGLYVQGFQKFSPNEPRFFYPKKGDSLFLFIQKILKNQSFQPSEENPSLQKLVKECWINLNVASGIEIEILRALAPDIVFVEGADFGSASHPHLFGALILSTGTLESRGKAVISRALIHEMAHQEIFLLNLIDPLIALKTASKERIYAPYQKKMRPPMGLVHATHALFRMLQYDSRESLEFAYIYDVFRQSLDQAKHLELSRIGKKLFQKYDELCP